MNSFKKDSKEPPRDVLHKTNEKQRGLSCHLESLSAFVLNNGLVMRLFRKSFRFC